MHALNDPKIIYICHPFGVDPGVNADQIRAECRRIASEQLLPLAPQLLLPQFVDEKTERGLAMLFCLRLVAAADEVWVYGNLSEGMRLEVARAKRLGIPVVQKDLPDDREPDKNRSRQRPETVNNQQRVIGSEKGTRALGDRGIKSLQPGG